MVKFYFYLNRLNRHINHCYIFGEYILCLSFSLFNPYGRKHPTAHSVVKGTEATL